MVIFDCIFDCTTLNYLPHAGESSFMCTPCPENDWKESTQGKRGADFQMKTPANAALILQG